MKDHARAAGVRQLFIYYRVPSPEADPTIAVVARMQAGLCVRHPGLQATLLRRPENEQPEVTLMETYALDAGVAPQGIDARLQADIEAAASAALGTGVARHVEVFDQCAS